VQGGWHKRQSQMHSCMNCRSSCSLITLLHTHTAHPSQPPPPVPAHAVPMELVQPAAETRSIHKLLMPTLMLPALTVSMQGTPINCDGGIALPGLATAGDQARVQIHRASTATSLTVQMT